MGIKMKEMQKCIFFFYMKSGGRVEEEWRKVGEKKTKKVNNIREEKQSGGKE
jgi:hypothetical protein